MERTFVIRNQWALGDTVLLSALARDVHETTGHRLCITHNYSKSFWLNNPHVVTDAKSPVTHVDMNHRAGIDACRAGAYKRHFMKYLFEVFSKRTGIKVSPRLPHGDIHLSAAEEIPPLSGRYWVLFAGHKAGMPTKSWPWPYWQDLVDRLAGRGIRCVQVGAPHDGRENFQPHLDRVVDLVGKTPDIRQLFRIVRHAEGVICGITSGMHLAAVWQKPCVVMAGGREAWTWIAYANVGGIFGEVCRPVEVEHRFLHTLGLLDCATPGGCWKRNLGRLSYHARKSLPVVPSLCAHPRWEGSPHAKCMAMITPAHVEDAVMGYYTSGTIPPIVPAAATPQFAELAEVRTKTREVKEKAQIPVEDWAVTGGKVAIFVLAYGDHCDLLRRCLSSVEKLTDKGTFSLHIGANAVSATTKAYIRECVDRGLVENVCWSDTNSLKYPIMRRMLAENPPKTPYFAWFDDDSFVRLAGWLPAVLRLIEREHKGGARMFGRIMFHDLTQYIRARKRPMDWFQAASWWRNKPFRVRGTKTYAPNGTCIDFIPGSFWLAHTRTFLDHGIPDARLAHNGGDITIGAQILQAGLRLCEFDKSDQFIRRTAAARRGVNSSFPWSK